ncbi:hypothetical protein ACIBEF_32165, partial [Micromonospora sp. NPDC050795]|uniref:hypothetical protein n=1 Tax=Micromonospora sp. NPDC050795 TaxID=3364282 RepID=UPI0037BC5593
MAPRNSDQVYAQALNRLPVGTPITQNTTVTLPGHPVPVPIGKLVSTLRTISASGGRAAAPDPALVAALAAHGLHHNPTTLPDGKWRLLPSGAKITWTDQDYAQALNSLPVGTRITGNTTVMLPGHSVPVPIGQLVNTLRNTAAHGGRVAAPDPALVSALAAHGLHHNPTALPDGRWRLLPSGARITWTDQDYAQALNRLPVGTPITNDTTVMLPGHTVPVPIGQLVKRLRSIAAAGGRVAAPDPALVTALAAHGLHHNPTALPDGKWRLQPSSAKITWTDQDYAQALNNLPVGTPITQNTTVMLPGHTVPVPIGPLVNTLQTTAATGGRAAPDPVLVAGLAAHGLHRSPTALPDGKWRLLPSGAKITWTDQDYAQALNRLPAGTRITGNTTVTLPGHPVPVPIGPLVKRLRDTAATGGRVAAPDPALVTALAAHGLHHNPTALPDGKWRLLPSGARIIWPDQVYAQALNRLPVGTPLTNDTTVMLPGHPVPVPIGQLVKRLRSIAAAGGRVAAPDPALVAALAAHGLHHNPTALPDGKWRLQPSGAKITWTDQDYVQALNRLPLGTPITHDTTVILPGHTVPVPIGQLVNTLRTTAAAGGRVAAPDPALVAALAAHGLHHNPTTLPDGKWRLLPSGANITWTDQDYAQALNRLPVGTRITGNTTVILPGHTVPVPIGSLMSRLRTTAANGGRTAAPDPALVSALAAHGLHHNPTALPDGKWRLLPS